MKKKVTMLVAFIVIFLGCTPEASLLESREAYIQGRRSYLQEKMADAQASFRLSLEKDASFLPARFMKAKTHIFLQQWGLAEEELKNILSVRNDHRDARFWLAKVYFLTNSPAKAEETLKPFI